MCSALPSPLAPPPFTPLLLPPRPAHICVSVMNRLSAPCPSALRAVCDAWRRQERAVTARLVASLRLLISGRAIMMSFAYLAEQRTSTWRILRTAPVCDHPLQNIKRLVNYFWGQTKPVHYAWKTDGTIARAVKLLR